MHIINMLLLVFLFLTLSTDQSFGLVCYPVKVTSTAIKDAQLERNEQKLFSISEKCRRSFIREIGTIALYPVAFRPQQVSANDKVPKIGRFEQLKGANSFIGVWEFESTKGITTGDLVFLKNGDVELRKSLSDETIIGVGAAPWKYVSPKGSDTLVTVYFTIDQDGEDDVLVFQGTFDLSANEKIMTGTIALGKEKVGSFQAKLKPNII